MNHLRNTWKSWREDRLLGRVVRNTGYLFSSSTVTMALGFIQGICLEPEPLVFLSHGGIGGEIPGGFSGR
jgi:hypothetical protein